MPTHYQGTAAEIRSLNAFIRFSRAYEPFMARLAKRGSLGNLTLTQFDSPLEASLAGNDSTTHVLIRVNVPKQAGTEEDLRTVFNITKRESQVLYWLSFGKTNWEIAQILDMSPRTVNKHLEQIYRKLEVDNRTSAVSMSIRVLEK